MRPRCPGGPPSSNLALASQGSPYKSHKTIAPTSTVPKTIQKIDRLCSPATQYPVAALKHRMALVQPLPQAAGLLIAFKKLCMINDATAKHYRKAMEFRTYQIANLIIRPNCGNTGLRPPSLKFAAPIVTVDDLTGYQRFAWTKSKLSYIHPFTITCI